MMSEESEMHQVKKKVFWAETSETQVRVCNR
jgi:hypothetical protein